MTQTIQYISGGAIRLKANYAGPLFTDKYVQMKEPAHYPVPAIPLIVTWHETGPYVHIYNGFPYYPFGSKGRFICIDCGGDGWGPMLTVEMWYAVTDPEEDEAYLCEECMSDRKGCDLESEDLRDCPLNYLHPLYKPHGIY